MTRVSEAVSKEELKVGNWMEREWIVTIINLHVIGHERYR